MGSILVVDDDVTCRESIKKILEREGHSVLGVPDVDSALAVLKVRIFDLMVCDYRMPGRNGLELLSELRRRNSVMPVLMVSAFADPETEATAKRLGVLAMLRKPFRRQQLVDEAHRSLQSAL